MKQHKWHKEIKAWADGAEIEFRYKDRYLGDEWELVEVLNDFGEEFEYRIKPQPIPSYKGDPTPTGIRKPKYMYVYLNDNYELSTIPLDNPKWKYIGKIKLEVEDGN